MGKGGGGFIRQRKFDGKFQRKPFQLARERRIWVAIWIVAAVITRRGNVKAMVISNLSFTTTRAGRRNGNFRVIVIITFEPWTIGARVSSGFPLKMDTDALPSFAIV